MAPNKTMYSFPRALKEIRRTPYPNFLELTGLDTMERSEASQDRSVYLQDIARFQERLNFPNDPNDADRMIAELKRENGPQTENVITLITDNTTEPNAAPLEYLCLQLQAGLDGY
eukprot:CAMPEP_0113646968 /NCGR_PEP_ID=MMETSP0017_2-20120614/24840_1 /TAXON_ID=2856 /ORGANISM="Cylindrotheca closterium" /LENGTH=114 /DNA_ID=CAMNT_0000558953 /DNA_START=12 /DNA_END=353 /DNA_ORIENTATION=- /assembly_acc=CAM_ASM_000147